MVLATDEVFTYAIFNYADMQWTSHTEAGGDTTGGEGGVPAFVSISRNLSVSYLFYYCKTLSIYYDTYRWDSTLATGLGVSSITLILRSQLLGI